MPQRAGCRQRQASARTVDKVAIRCIFIQNWAYSHELAAPTSQSRSLRDCSSGTLCAIAQPTPTRSL
ncbi:MAG: hypothetical protein F6J93_28445 [Oscillatoria sp. SIO1A7]|nr:hypothetical protein [Oscillatoria sp. SIO1A7]